MSTINDTDQFLVQRGITSHKQSAVDLMSTIQDTDLMLVQRGTDSYKVTCKDVKDQLGGGGIEGDVNQPTVVKPKDGAGSGDTAYALSDKITKIEGGGVTTCETELIESVTQQQSDGNWSGNYTVVNSNEDCNTPTSSYCPRVFFDGTQTKGYQVGLANNIVVGRQYTIEYVNTFPAGSYALKWNFGREGPADMRDFSVYVDGVKRVIHAGNFGGDTSGTFEWQQSAPFTSLKFEAFGVAVLNAGIALQELSVNGTRLVDGTPVDIGTVLTFPSDQGFSCFPPDTVVQGSDGSIITSVAAKYTPLAGGMAGNNINTFSWSAATNRPSGDLTLNTDFNVNGEVFAVYSSTPFKATAGRVTPSAAAPMSLAASDDGENWFVVDWKADPGYQDPSKWLESPTAHKYFALYRADSGTQGVVGADMDGGYGFGAAINDAVKVISIDDSDPYTIVVDGGRWQGADGSGDQPMTGVDNSQDWPSVITMSPAANTDNAFDNDLNTAATAQPGGEMNVNMVNPPSISTLEVYTTLNGGGINMGAGIVVNFDGPGWYSVPGPYPNGLQFSIDCRTSGGRTPSVRAWRVDGNVAVLQSIDTSGGDTKLTKETPYDTKLTVATDKDFGYLLGTSWMTDGQGAPGPYAQTPYLVTSDTIVRVENNGIYNDYIGNISAVAYNDCTGSDTANTCPKALFLGGGSRIGSPDLSSGSSYYMIYNDIELPAGDYSFNWKCARSGPGLLGNFRVTADQQYTVFSGNMPDFDLHTFNFTATQPFTTLRFDVDNSALSGEAHVTISDFSLNGTVLEQGKPIDTGSGEKILTLASDQDLAYFRVGDVVQEKFIPAPAQTWSAYCVTGNEGSSPTANAFDGNLSTHCLGAAGGQIVFTTPPGVTFSGQLEVYGNSEGFSDSGLLTVASDEGNVNSYPLSALTWYDCGTQTNITSIEVKSNRSSRQPGLTALRLDGQFIKDGDSAGTISVQTKIVSINDSDPYTIVVDGGKWDNSNQSQVWSSLLTASGSGFKSDNPATDAFDGDFSSLAITEDANGTLTLNLTGLGLSGPVEVNYGTGNAGDYTATFVGSTGTEVQTLTLGALVTGTWRGPVDVGTIATISVTTTSGSQMNLVGVKVAGKVLVDAVNDSQVWSSNTYFNSNGHGYITGTIQDVFDGQTPQDTVYYCLPDTDGVNNSYFDLNFGSEFTSATSVEIGVYANLTNNIDVNGSDVSSSIVFTNGKYGSVTVDVTGTGLNTIKWFYNKHTTGGYCYVGWIKVDGKLLVDQGIRDFGDTDVRYQTKGGKGDIISVNATDKTILLTDTGDRDNRWIAENGADIDFKVAGPDYVDGPLLTSNVELESSQFSTTPATNPDTGQPLDGLAKITWSLKPGDGAEYELDAGTLNPYRPTGLQVNTTYTIKVKHTGLLLGDSPWSTSTTFQTGASRSLNDHYMKQIKVLEEELREARNS